MKKKVTLSIDEEKIRKAEEYARRRGKPLSQLVEDYFAVMGEPIEPRRKEELSPIVRSLTGSLKGALKGDGVKGHRDAYSDYLEEEH